MRYRFAIGIVVVLAGGAGNVARGAEGVRLETADTALVFKSTPTGADLAFLGRPGDGWNWLTKAQAFLPSMQEEVGGKFSPIDWKSDGIKQEALDSASLVQLRFTSQKPALEMLVVWTAHPGPGPIEQTIQVKNVGQAPVRVGGMPSLLLNVQPQPSANLEYTWVEKGAARPPLIGTHRLPVGHDFHHRSFNAPWATKFNSHEAIPWVALRDLAGGEGLYAVISTSAFIAQQIDHSPDGGSLQISLGLDEHVATELHEIEPGATFDLPPAMIGCFKGLLDEGCNHLHRWAERWHAPRATDQRFPLLANCTWGRGAHIDEASCLKMSDDAADLGIDIFHIDAGWYQSVGLWQPDPKKFPHGLRPISDHVHEKGMKFGLWAAWAQGGATPPGQNALSVFDPAMHDWFPMLRPEGWKPGGLSGQIVCLGSAGAQAWCEQETQRLVFDYRLDMLEHDQQVLVRKCEHAGHGHTTSAVDASLAATQGYAKIYSELRRKYPDLILENCVDGGATVDYAMMGLCDYVSITDTYDPLSNRQAFYDASFPLPPRMLECYVAEHPSKTLDNFRYTLRSGMMGWCSVMIDTTQWNAAEHVAAKRQFEIFQKQLRPLIRDADLYHISERPRDDGWDAYEYISQDRSQGAMMVFRGVDDDESRQMFRLAGLTPKAKYQVTFEDHPERKETIEGASLMAGGLAIDLPGVETSEIVWLKKVD